MGIMPFRIQATQELFLALVLLEFEPPTCSKAGVRDAPVLYRGLRV